MEIGWRLGKNHCGHGLCCAFNTLGLDEVVAFTSLNNKGSLPVMNQGGMTDTGLNFMHSDINKSSNLCEHVLYKITRTVWWTNKHYVKG